MVRAIRNKLKANAQMGVCFIGFCFFAASFSVVGCNRKNDHIHPQGSSPNPGTAKGAPFKGLVTAPPSSHRCEVYLHWGKEPDVQWWDIYRKTAKSFFETTVLPRRKADDLDFSDDSVEAGHKYIYFLSSYGRAGFRIRGRVEVTIPNGCKTSRLAEKASFVRRVGGTE